ncbi:MAG: hypothetical protein AB7I38_15910 [Dehalococcoidia bacterium]
MPDLERRLRGVLRPTQPDDAIGRRLRAAVPVPLPGPVTRRRRFARAATARRLRPVAVAAAGLLGLVGVVVLLVALMTVTGGEEGGDPSAVAPPPPPRYGILDRPQTAGEATLAWPATIGDPAPGSVRAAGAGGGQALLVARLEAGPVCIRRVAANDAVDEECGRPTSAALRLVTPWPDGAGAPVEAFGLVPDAVTAVRIGDRTVQPRENTWSAGIDPDAAPVTVDFLTADGVIEAWRIQVELDSAATDLLAAEPYLGITCRPGDPGCDRVGLSVRLRQPASAVRAEIDGRAFPLEDPLWSGPATPAGLRRTFAGFLEPAGLDVGALAVPEAPSGRWTGNPPVETTVSLEVVAADGSTRRTTVKTTLRPGWG